MRSFSWHKRLLPLTMTVMALLFTEKAVSLAREATTSSAVTAGAAQTLAAGDAAAVCRLDGGTAAPAGSSQAQAGA